MTAAVDREVLREWRDRHGDVQRDREGHACVRLVWVDGRYAGQCGETSQWFVRGRTLCEPHAVERVQQWLDLERGERSA
jgi:hypothetical protein